MRVPVGMVQNSSSNPNRPDTSKQLGTIVDNTAVPHFVVIDGGKFDDLPSYLTQAGIYARSLFLDHRNKSFQQSGPWFFPLDSINARRHAEALALEKPCAVFWSCAEGELALWRHLRTINEVLIPIGRGGESGKHADRSGFERVLFRHWDPNVLMQVLPTLDQGQFARFFGPATQVDFLPGEAWGGRLTSSHRPEPAMPSHGPLRLDSHAIAQIEATRKAVQQETIVNYLKTTLPPLKEPPDDNNLRNGVVAAVSGAEAFGISDQPALCRWAYLYFVSGGAINSDANISKFMRSKDFKANPNEKVRQIMDAMIYATKEKAKCL